jgi:hypothetical protein
VGTGCSCRAANWLVACWLVQAWQHYWYALCSVSGSVPGTALLQREGLSFSWCVILLIRVKTIFIRKKKKRVKTIFLVPGEIFRFLRARAADPRADLVSQRHPLIRFSGGSVLSDTAKMASAAASYRCGVAGGFVAI